MSGVAQRRAKPFRLLAWLALSLLCGTAAARAQLTVGDDISMKMNGTLGYGYSAGWGNQQDGNHASSLIGEGLLTGAYYNPNFINFQVRPFWDRAQSNSGIQVINRQSGIDSSVNFFTGSEFPGYVTFSKQFSSNGQTGIGDSASMRTTGSQRAFGIGWSELIPDLPPVYANFAMSAGSFNTLGGDATNTNHQSDFNTGTNYNYAGFDLSANFNHDSWNYDYGDLAGLTTFGSGSSNNLSVSARRPIPLNGSLGLSWGHNNRHSDSNTSLDGSSTSESASATIRPLNRVSLGGMIQRTSNLSTALSQLLSPTGELSSVKSDYGSNALSMSGSASWAIMRGLNATGFVIQSRVHFNDRDYTTTQYGGNLNYHFEQGFLKMFRFSIGLADNMNKEGNRSMAMVGSINMDHRFGHWDVSSDYGYTQDMQTLYGISATSRHSYGGSIRRRFSETTFWSGSFRGGHSGLSGQAGNGNHNESISSNITFRRYTAGGSYNRASGTAVMGVTGISDPITGIELLTNNFLYTQGHSVSVSGSARLRYQFVLNGAYVKSYSNVDFLTSNSTNNATTYFGQLDWRLRKMSFIAGFSRTKQDSTRMVTGPYLVNSVYVSFSRWFNVF